jgi:hypothetical protein
MFKKERPDSGTAKGRRVLRAGCLLLALVLFLVGSFVLYQRWPGEAPLSDASEVKSMRAELHNSPQGLPLPQFDVPSHHIPRVLAALSPHERDAAPAKWQVLGSLRLVYADGRTGFIDLYSTGAAKGAFSTGLSNRLYYRGGTDKGIENAIRDAHREAVSAKTNDSR